MLTRITGRRRCSFLFVTSGLFTLLWLLAGCALPLRGSSYNKDTKEITCYGQEACLHEIGHAIDDQSKWISESARFKNAVATYREIVWQSPEQRNNFSQQIYNFPCLDSPCRPEYNPVNEGFWTGGWGGYKELYASIFAWAGGNIETIPPTFQEFYQVKTVNKVINNFNRKQK